MIFFDRVKTVGILAIFFEDYAEAAILEFRKLIDQIDKNGLMLVVNNNPDLQPNLPPGALLINGNNILHEFGAWQMGLDYLRNQKDFELIDLFFFGNDTLCHHHRMGHVERLAFFLSSVGPDKNARGRASGELSTMGRSFRIDDVTMDAWISTYLFSLDRQALIALDWRIHGSYEEIEKWVPGGHDETMFFAAFMDESLRAHLTGWLFGRKGFPCWYKSSQLSLENCDFFRNKALAIICEKMLTSRLIRKKIAICSVFEIYVIRIIFKFFRIAKNASFGRAFKFIK